MGYLIDTNVLSELRKGTRCQSSVALWFAEVTSSDLFVSVLLIGEVRGGIERLRRRDPSSAERLDEWLVGIERDFSARILPVSRDIADLWGRLNVPSPVAPIDGLLASTALAHGHTLVTRNTKDVARTGVRLLNPFDIQV